MWIGPWSNLEQRCIIENEITSCTLSISEILECPWHFYCNGEGGVYRNWILEEASEI